MPEDYHWHVLYADGTDLREVEPDGTEHPYQEVDVERVVSACLWPQAEGLRQVVVQLPAGRQLVFFRLRRHRVDLGTGESEPQPGVTVMGWDGAYACCYADGSVLLTDDWGAA